MRKVLFLAIVLVPFALQGQQSADEKAVRDTEAAWSKAAQAKSVEQFASFYADDAAVFQPNAKVAKGKAAVRSAVADLFKPAGFALSFKTVTAAVSKSGDIAYTTGTYAMTMNDAKGKPVKDTGNYVTVYKKVGGQWKAVADIFNSELPAPK